MKEKIKTSLFDIVKDPNTGKALKDELKGLWSYRAKRIRIIYRFSGKYFIDIIAIGPRRNIYQETYRLLKKTK